MVTEPTGRWIASAFLLRFLHSSSRRIAGISLADRRVGSVSLRVFVAFVLTLTAGSVAGDLSAQAPEPRVIEIVAKRYALSPRRSKPPLASVSG